LYSGLPYDLNNIDQLWHSKPSSSMDFQTLEARNTRTLNVLRIAIEKLDINQHPFHGYLEVDLFECPKFLMFTNNDCPRAWNILFDKYIEPQSMRIWCRLARNATGILDIGAHVGVYSLSAAALRSDISIHAFEPNPHAYTRLRVNKMVNEFKQIVEHQFVVGNANQYVDFSWFKKKPTQQISSGAGIGKRNDGTSEHTVVPMRMLDGSGLAATLGAKPLVKIDVEGAEAATIQGMTEVLQLRPDIILESFEAKACAAINAVMLPLGYRVFLVHERSEGMTARAQLEACDMRGEDFNQFLTTRSDDELRALGLL
jgi:FkbM family methyltransferase